MVLWPCAPRGGRKFLALKAEIISLSSEVKDLSELNDTLRAEHDRLTAENLRLATALRTLEAAASAAPPVDAPPPGWIKEKSELETKIQELSTKLEMLRSGSMSSKQKRD